MALRGDLSHTYGQDLDGTPSGDIAVATNDILTQQRVIRRLLTAPTDIRGSAYPWVPGYGVGLGERIGDPLQERPLRADVRSQMLLEPTVQKIPPPIIKSTPINDGATIDVQYTDENLSPKSFNFDLFP